MVGHEVLSERQPSDVVKLVCPRCRFVIAAFTACELQRDSIKRKRYQSLLTRQQLCGSCLCTVRRLEELWEKGGERE